MEADFQRDYGIDLGGETLKRMSWRRFRALLDNLSPRGAVALRVLALREQPLRGPRAAERFFDSCAGREVRPHGP